MFNFISSFSCILLTAGWVQAAYPAPIKCSGTCTNAHDSALIQRESDGNYYRFSTSGGLSIHTAPDITGPWAYQGFALEATTDRWAPDVSLVGDTYYLYYAVSSFGSQNSHIGVATSPTMEPGSWKDLGSTGIESREGSAYNAIDPNLLNDDGTYYLTFGSFWGDIYQASMESAPTHAAGTPYNVELNSTGSRASEGAYLFKHDKHYYLFWSSGICCGYDRSMPAAGGEYKIMVCRSESATGDFVDANGVPCTRNGGTQVLSSHDNIYGPGGQGVYNDSKYGPILYYHYVDTNIGFADGDKRLGINKLDFSSGWPVVSV